MACSASREFSNRGEFRDRTVSQSRISFGCCRERASGGRSTLVFRLRNMLTVTLQGLQNLVGGFVPHERLRILIVHS